MAPRGEGRVRTEAETGLVWPQARGDHWQTPLQSLQGSVALPTPSFQTSGLRSCERTHSERKPNLCIP